MPLLRILLKLTRPEKVPSPRKKQLPWGAAIHKSLLSFLAHYYRQYASHNVISVGKDIQFVRSVRDLDFEAELKRMGFDVKPHLTAYKSKSLKKTRKNPYFKPFINCFSFSDTICIEAADLNIMLERADEINVTSTVDAKIMISTPEDFIIRSTVSVSNKAWRQHNGIRMQKLNEPDKQSAEPDEQTENSDRKNARGNARRDMRGRIFRDELPVKEPVETTAPSTTIVRGIEIDNDF